MLVCLIHVRDPQSVPGLGPVLTTTLLASFTMTTRVGLYIRLTGRWNPALAQLNLGRWGLLSNIIAFH